MLSMENRDELDRLVRRLALLERRYEARRDDGVVALAIEHQMRAIEQEIASLRFADQ